jgi:hypothetical protein
VRVRRLVFGILAALIGEHDRLVHGLRRHHVRRQLLGFPGVHVGVVQLLDRNLVIGRDDLRLTVGVVEHGFQLGLSLIRHLRAGTVALGLIARLERQKLLAALLVVLDHLVGLAEDMLQIGVLVASRLVEFLKRARPASISA